MDGGIDLNVALEVAGKQGPARSQEEADADAAAGQAMIDQKRARLAELAAGFEVEGHSPERAKVLAAQAYHQG
jgi:hypothetical protein